MLPLCPDNSWILTQALIRHLDTDPVRTAESGVNDVNKLQRDIDGDNQ